MERESQAVKVESTERHMSTTQAATKEAVWEKDDQSRPSTSWQKNSTKKWNSCETMARNLPSWKELTSNVGESNTWTLKNSISW